jgi:hypothetical protein
MEDITESIASNINTERKKQKISNEIRKLIVAKMNSGSKPKEVAAMFKVK